MQKVSKNIFFTFPQATIALKVSSDVSGILTTSNSFITGTGLKKWSPPNLKTLRMIDAFLLWLLSEGKMDIWIKDGG